MSKKRRYPRRDLVGWKVLSSALIAAMCIAHFPPVFAEETSPTHFGLLEAWSIFRLLKSWEFSGSGDTWNGTWLNGVRKGDSPGGRSTTTSVMFNAMVFRPW